MAWTHFIAEEFCMYDSCKDRITKWFKFKEDENGEWFKDKKGNFVSISSGKGKNPCYIKGGEKKRPKWCKKKFGKNRRYKDMTPNPECLFEKCPYLSMTEVDKSEYIVMVGAWERAGRKGLFKHLEDGSEPVISPFKNGKTLPKKRL